MIWISACYLLNRLNIMYMSVYIYEKLKEDKESMEANLEYV